jgi:hypothetical protein
MQVSDMLMCLQSAECRRVFRRLLVESMLEQGAFNSDPTKTAYNEGLRALGLWLKHEIEAADASAYYTIMMEG